jgi:hypothetical protein
MPHANQVLVTIAVQDQRLSVYPRRDTDVVVYCNSTNPRNAPQSPEKPREVCWMATGRNPNQKIQITAKAPGTGIFGRDNWEISDGVGNIAETGPVRVGPPKGQIGVWYYSITLLDNGERRDHIDPTVVIKTDP